MITQDWNNIRSQFPVLKTQVNGHALSYLDNGASSQMPESVIDRLASYHQHEHANIHRGVHYLSQTATTTYEETRSLVADFLNAESLEQIIFTTGTTDSINLVAESWGVVFFQMGMKLFYQKWNITQILSLADDCSKNRCNYKSYTIT